MSDAGLPFFVQELLKPDLYPHPVDEVKLVQTHISFVFIAGDFVYKFKKSVDFGFLDFSTLDKRKFCCEQELHLNRRLCPDIYLAVVRVNRDDDTVCMDGSGEVIEYGVKMRKMPLECMMGEIIRKGELDEAHIKNIVDVLVPFYEKAENSRQIDKFGLPESVAINVLENFEQSKQFVGSEALSDQQFDAISSYAKNILTDEELFLSRIKEGKIRDCHGDLYSANICLSDKVYIYDCIEFNQRFRYCDIASDVAFLVMDLQFHGLSDLADYFVDTFCKEAKDTGLKTLLDFYCCYRACVRGKIGLFTANDPAVDDRVKQQSLSDAAKYFELAHSYAVKG